MHWKRAMQIPTAEENPHGFHQRYCVTKPASEPDPNAVYLVLRLDKGGSDAAWTSLGREMARRLCLRIKETESLRHLTQMADELYRTADALELEHGRNIEC